MVEKTKDKTSSKYPKIIVHYIRRTTRMCRSAEAEVFH